MEKHLIRNIPESGRPYERLELFGVKALSDAELLAILLKTGSSGQSALFLSAELIQEAGQNRGLSFIHDFSVDELREYKGIGRVKAITLKAAAELGRRSMQSVPYWKNYMIRKPQDAISVFENEMYHLKKEEVHVLLLDTRHRVIRRRVISSGGLSSTCFFPRDLLREAIKANAAALVMGHNHPSGDPSPSKEDIASTKELMKAMDLLGIAFIDHIIIGKGASVSLRELSYI